MITSYLKLIFDYFKKYNIDIYLVGGSARDYLLNKDFDDLDFATPVNTKDLIDLLEIEEYDKFSLKFGTLKTNILGREVEITTFREEGTYSDHRRPNQVKFVNDLNIDAKRRDFTINSIYIDSDFNVIDPNNGLEDLKNKTLKMIGDPYIRLKEDPVRILRAIRFSKNMHFKLDKELKKAIEANLDQLQFISKHRLSKELNKFKNKKDYYDFISDKTI